MKTGHDLRDWRKKKNLTQKELAAMFNYRLDRIAHIEQENAKLSKRLLNELRRVTEAESDKARPVAPIIFKNKTDDSLIYIYPHENKNFSIYFSKENFAAEGSMLYIIQMIIKFGYSFENLEEKENDLR